MDIETAIRTIRKQKGLTQKELASVCGISTNALCSIENNYTMPAKATITKICQSLNIPSAYLLFFSIQDEDLPKDSQTLFNALFEPLKIVLLEDISNCSK